MNNTIVLFFRRYALSLILGFLPSIAYMQGPASNLLPGDPAINEVADFYVRICWITQWVMVFGLIIGVLFIIYGGVRYITSAGDDSKARDAKSTIVTAIIGVVFLLLSVALINIVANFFGSGAFDFNLTNCSGASAGAPAGAPAPTTSTGGSIPPPPPPPPPGGSTSPTPIPTTSTGGVPPPPPPPPP